MCLVGAVALPPLPPPPQPPPPPQRPDENATEAQMAILREVANRLPELRGPAPPFDTSLMDQWRIDIGRYIVENPNFTLDQVESFIRNWITSNGGTLAPRSPDLPPLIESFVNRAKKIYQDFTSRFSLMPTEYAPAL